MACLPKGDDIVHLDAAPSSGRRMNGPHSGLLFSHRFFNPQGLTMIGPIPQGAAAAIRTHGTVTLPGAGTDIQDAVHCHRLKFLDWRAEKPRLEESAPQHSVDEVLAWIETILLV